MLKLYLEPIVRHRNKLDISQQQTLMASDRVASTRIKIAAQKTSFINFNQLDPARYSLIINRIEAIHNYFIDGNVVPLLRFKDLHENIIKNNIITDPVSGLSYNHRGICLDLINIYARYYGLLKPEDQSSYTQVGGLKAEHSVVAHYKESIASYIQNQEQVIASMSPLASSQHSPATKRARKNF